MLTTETKNKEKERNRLLSAFIKLSNGRYLLPENCSLINYMTDRHGNLPFEVKRRYIEDLCGYGIDAELVIEKAEELDELLTSRELPNLIG